MPVTLSRVGDFTLGWGESLRWDDRRQRLYFVDMASQTLHWLDGGAPPIHGLQLPSMPAGLVLTEGTDLVTCMDDGIYLVEPDAGTSSLLSAYPDGMHGRANDANADGFGNLVTGTLNVAPGPGSLWSFSIADGWRLLDEQFGNINGPVVLNIADDPTLVVADTLSALLYAYPYDPAQRSTGSREVFGDHRPMGGFPDGAAADNEDAVWSCVLGAGRLARFTAAGVDQVIDLPVRNPSSVAFGGEHLDQLFITSIEVDLTGDTLPTPEAGWVLVARGHGVTGRPEARFNVG